MPTVLRNNGWRIFFYSNEGHEPMHIHGIKGETEVKHWINQKSNMISYANSFNLTPSLKREFEEIILKNLSLIISSWNSHFNYYQ